MTLDRASSRRVTAAWLGVAAALAARAGLAGWCEFTLRPAGGEPAGAVAGACVWPLGVDAGRAVLAVRTLDGRPVPHERLWQAPGEAWTFRFDAASATGWVARVTDEPAEVARAAAAPAWRPQAGLVLETRAFVDGPVETVAEVQELWRRGAGVLGRSEVAQIHHGVHPHGPTFRFMSRYEGWLRAPADGRYGFATLSDDASFLLVDGRPVAGWGGWHGVEGGLHAQHAGAVDLRRGAHRIEYYNVQDDGGFNVSAAWRPPGAAHYATIPERAFIPVMRTRVAAVAAADAAAAAAAFGWEVEAHALVDGQVWAWLRVWALGDPRGGVCRWRFDDGSVREGDAAAHLLAGPALRSVTLDVLRGGQGVARLSQRVQVRPRWTQRHDFPEPVYERLRGELLRLDLGRLAPADLAAHVRFAERVADDALLGELGNACLRRPADLRGPAADALFRLGLFFQKPGVRRYADTLAAWRAVLADPAAEPALHARTQLHLAGFLVHSGGSVAEARALLDAAAPALAGAAADLRLLGIYRGDAAAAAGDADAAQRLYREAGGTVAADDTDYEVRRLARLERARVYLRQREFDAAEAVLRELEWERPLNRLGLETGLLLVAVYRGRGEAPFALAACRRLAAVAPPGPQGSTLLRVTAEVCDEQGLEGEARAALARLHEAFPYSEDAALASERWGPAAAGAADEGGGR